MPSSRPIDRLEEIITNCDRIQEYTKDIDYGAYEKGPQIIRVAVERCFQRTAKLPTNSAVVSNPPIQRRIGKAFAALVTSYGTNTRSQNLMIWNGIIEDVPKMKLAATVEIRRLRGLEEGNDNVGPASPWAS